jgi:beta-glucosidase-like glycosyl hydrolase
MKEMAQLVMADVVWAPGTGYAGARALIEQALEMGVGSYRLTGGEQDAVHALTKELRQRSRVPPLIAANLERGAGEQFLGATGLPPLGAIAWLGDIEAVRRAARLTAREARTIGVNWNFAPVCDLDLDPARPEIGERTFGSDPALAATYAAAWIGACQAEGVLACAKHFPGVGRGGAVIDASTDALYETDLAPFRAAIEAGVASLMTADVAYPALDPSGAPAMRSREILHWLLRQRLKFDALVMSENVAGGDEGVVAAIRAGCDLVLAADLDKAVTALEAARHGRSLDDEKLHQSQRRRLKWAQWASPPNAYRKPSQADAAWGAQLAERTVHTVRGTVGALAPPIDVVVIAADGSAPCGSSVGAPFIDTLIGAEQWDVRVAERPGSGLASPVIVALFGFQEASRRALATVCREASGVGRTVIAVQFAHPRLAAMLTEPAAVVSAWDGARAMQQAAARWLRRQR